MKYPSYDIIIPIFKPDADFERVLGLLKKQVPAPEQIILLETLEEGVPATPYEGCLVLPVKKAEFDHAATRSLGIAHSHADAFLLMTQDAIPQGTDLAENLLKELYGDKTAGKNIAICYGRQIAGPESSLQEQETRAFNYPEHSFVKNETDLPRLGIKTYFSSNVCCMYDRKCFEELKGFEPRAIFNEDMLFAAKACRQGYAIAYCAGAEVQHSHNYTAMQQFHRMFDNGMSQAMHPEYFAGISNEGEGFRLIFNSAAGLLKSGHPLQIAALFWQAGFKYLGFRMGKNYKKYSYKKLRRLALNKAFIDREFKE